MYLCKTQGEREGGGVGGRGCVVVMVVVVVVTNDKIIDQLFV